MTTQSQDSESGAPPRRLGDRRRHPRLEVVGTFLGALEYPEPATVVNISRGGALIQVDTPVIVFARLPLTLSRDEATLKLDSSVRHVTAVSGADGRSREYRAGIEFPSPLAALAEDEEDEG